MPEYPIETYNSDSDLAFLVSDHSKPYGTEVTMPDGRRFVHCYTALTTFTKGSLACITLTPGAAAGQNPRATKPATTAIAQKWGVCAETVAAAGGIWVQIYGRCKFAEVEGGTQDIAIGHALKAVNATWYLIYDAGSILTAVTLAYAESVEADAIAVQELVSAGGTGHCTNDNSVFLLDRWATL